MLLPLVTLGRALTPTVPMTSKPIIIKRVNQVGRDAVAFLYPTKPMGFVWYMNHDEPFDSHFERGGGSTYTKLVKNKDGSWTASDNERVKFNLNVDPNYKDAIGGCKMSFKDSMARGYTYDKTDLDNVELTGSLMSTSQQKMTASTSEVLVIITMKVIIFAAKNSTTTVKPIAILRRPVQQPNSQSKVQTNIITTLQGLKR